MPIYWTEERLSRTGAQLPYTEIRVGGLTLCFNGRQGSKLREAVNCLEAQQARRGQQEGSGSDGNAEEAAGAEAERAAGAEGAPAAGAEEGTEAMTIQGFASTATEDGGCLVLVDGQELPLAPSLRLRNHSPSGFQWGYSGSGPAQLALALLLFAGVDSQDAEDLYQVFKAAHVAGWPNGEDFSVSLDIRAWVRTAQGVGRALGAPRMSER